MRSSLAAALTLSIFTTAVAPATALTAASAQCRAVFGVHPISLWSKLTRSYEGAKARVTLTANAFTVSRPLYATQRPGGGYANELAARFLNDLAGLDSRRHWIDIGAGEGRAIRDYYNDPAFASKARVTAISYRRPSGAAGLESLSPNFRYLSGQLLEKFATEEIGTADLVTDVVGALAYSRQMDETLFAELRLLAPGGRLYASEPFHTRMRAGGRDLSWAEYLSLVQGIELDIDARGLITIVRSSGALSVPQLEVLKFKSDTPPVRVYRVVGP